MKIDFSPCSCLPAEVLRIPRASWMRLLLPRRRLYLCPHCQRRFLAPLSEVVGVRVVR